MLAQGAGQGEVGEQPIATVRYGAAAGADNFDEYTGFSPSYHFTRAGDAPFHAHAAFWQLGDLAVTDHAMGALVADRSAAAHRTWPADHLTIVVVADGSIDYESADHCGTCGAGEVMFFDYRRIYRHRTPGHRGVSVSFARTLVEDRLGPIAFEGPLPRTGETRMLADFLLSLVRQLPDVTPSSVPTLVTVFRQLLILALRSAVPCEGAVGGNVRQRAIGWLDAHPAATLDPAALATALGVSRASLYRAFQGDGGVVAFDRARRLRRLHLALLDAAPGTRLGELAAEHGFFDLSALARRFRTHFGHSMSDVRAHRSAPKPRTDPAEPIAHFRDAIGRLTWSDA